MRAGLPTLCQVSTAASSAAHCLASSSQLPTVGRPSGHTDHHTTPVRALWTCSALGCKSKGSWSSSPSLKLVVVPMGCARATRCWPTVWGGISVNFWHPHIHTANPALPASIPCDSARTSVGLKTTLSHPPIHTCVSVIAPWPACTYSHASTHNHIHTLYTHDLTQPACTYRDMLAPDRPHSTPVTVR